MKTKSIRSLGLIIQTWVSEFLRGVGNHRERRQKNRKLQNQQKSPAKRTINRQNLRKCTEKCILLLIVWFM